MSAGHCSRCPLSREAILIVLLSALAWPVIMFDTYNVINPDHGATVGAVMTNIYCLCGLTYPVAGWITDTWIGRYHVLLPSLYLSFTAAIISGVGALFGYAYWLLNALNDSAVPVIESTVFVGYVLRLIGHSVFVATALPYAIDHMINEGASGKQLSDLIRWYYWGMSTSLLVFDSLVRVVDDSVEAVILPLAQSLCLTLAIMSHHLCHHFLHKTPLTWHPIRQIARVLNYARKHKCPERRSAFTYWEQDYPSRIDLGKCKYGGPFTEEEVEDVKTILRLTVLMLLATVVGLGKDQFELVDHLDDSSSSAVGSAFLSGSLLTYIAPALLLPVYQLIIYPVFHTYLPSTLRGMGYAILLSLISMVTFTCIESIGHAKSPEALCYVKNATSVISIGYHWIALPRVLQSMGLMLMHSSCLVFVVAQSPHQMRGFMVGLYYSFYNLWQCFGFNFSYAFLLLDMFPMYCLIYSFLIKSVIVGVIFLLYIIFSHRYTLRVRDEVVNFHVFAWDHFDSSQREKKKYYLTFPELV